MPLRYSHGSAAATRALRRTYGGASAELNFTPAPLRSRTFGTSTGTGPTAVRISRSGSLPLRTTARRPSSNRTPSNCASSASTSASIARWMISRAPRRTSSSSGNPTSARPVSR
jgi:hypothetical protein